jgi:hypothetical protein
MRLATSVGGHSVDGWRGTRTGRFVRHLLEMTVAMVLGMVVLGTAFGEIHLLVFGSGFDQAWHRHVELTAFAMAFNMTLPMVACMRHRGHSWERGGEMAAAMNLPLLPVCAVRLRRDPRTRRARDADDADGAGDARRDALPQGRVQRASRPACAPEASA